MAIQWIALRVIQEIVRDRRTLAIFFIVPMIVMSLIYYALNEDETVSIGIVSHKEMKNIEKSLILGLKKNSGVKVKIFEYKNSFNKKKAFEKIKNEGVQGVIYLNKKLLEDRVSGKNGFIEIFLEGSRPTVTSSILASIASSTGDLSSALFTELSKKSLFLGNLQINVKPMEIKREYLYGSEKYKIMDFFLPVFPPFFIFFFTFILSTVTFQRERLRGTLDRLLIAPVSFAQVVTGYVCGFFIFSFFQAIIILSFIIALLGFSITISQLSAILIITIFMMLIALVSGLLASFLASNEFQALQFIPLVVLPQIFLSDIIWSIDEFPLFFRIISKLLPLTHANVAMRNVLIKNQTILDTFPQLGILTCFFFTALMLLVLAAKREKMS
jgi:ABC-2 type transport system permease protein